MSERYRNITLKEESCGTAINTHPVPFNGMGLTFFGFFGIVRLETRYLPRVIL